MNTTTLGYKSIDTKNISVPVWNTCVHSVF